MLPLSADCRENKILIERDILVKITSQLDSFEVLKKLEIKYLSFKDSCVIMAKTQSSYIETQSKLIFNQDKQIDNLLSSEKEYKNLMKVNDELLKTYQKKAKIGKRNTVISLVGGGVLTIGLTTILILTLIQ